MDARTSSGRLFQTAGAGSSKGTVTDCGTLHATANKCRGHRRAKSPWANVGDAEQISRQLGGCHAMEAAVHEHH